MRIACSQHVVYLLRDNLVTIIITVIAIKIENRFN